MSFILNTLQRAVTFSFHLVTAGYFQHPIPENPSMTRKHIIIVGGSFAGIGTAHRLLKQAAKNPIALPIKITLITRDTHLFWNIAMTRGIIPGQFPDEVLFQSIAPGFAHYQAGLVEVVIGSLTSVNAESKTVVVGGGDGKESKIIDYDFLVLATGTHVKGEDMPLKSLGSTAANRTALYELQAKVQKSKKIVVIGGGPTGVSIAGELAYEYKGSKEIILLCRGSTVLADRPAKVSKTALQQLRSLNVDVRTDIKLFPSANEKSLLLSNGESLLFDLQIPTYGNVPNSSYLPTQFLDTNGFIKVGSHLQVVGVNTEDVFAIGDVSSVDAPQFLFADSQSKYITKHIVCLVNGKKAAAYEPWTKGLIGVQIGKELGTGHYGNVQFPSFFVTWLRKGLFTDKVTKMIDGSEF